jgi:hypothetical protein
VRTVPRKVEVKPGSPEDSTLPAAEVRHGDDEEPTLPQQLTRTFDVLPRPRNVLERVLEDDRVEEAAELVRPRRERSLHHGDATLPAFFAGGL